MKRIKNLMWVLLVVIIASGCVKESNKKDRSDASEMFRHISSLAKNYAERLSNVSDSVEWAIVCREFEDSLDKINFSYPPDTDLLMTEGQNDTIHSLLVEYIKIRDERIHEILHPYIEIDSIPSDSMMADNSTVTSAVTLEDASHSLGN